jgi:hypothetical protein
MQVPVVGQGLSGNRVDGSGTLSRFVRYRTGITHHPLGRAHAARLIEARLAGAGPDRDQMPIYDRTPDHPCRAFMDKNGEEMTLGLQAAFPAVPEALEPPVPSGADGAGNVRHETACAPALLRASVHDSRRDA